MIKFPYKAMMRYAGTNSFLVQWYFANDGAKVIPFPIAFGSSRSDVPDKLDLGGLGEVYERNPPRVFEKLPTWLKGEHFCGSRDQWQNGYPVGTPGPLLGPDGEPVCCGVQGAAFDFGFDLGYDS